MGLSFHYKGKLKNPFVLQKMVDEVASICKANQWEFSVLEDHFEGNSFTLKPNKDKLYGICFTPPKCETVRLSFLSNGKLCDLVNWFSKKDLEDLDTAIYLYFLSVKTQYCGPAIHKILISIFDYIQEKYLKDFEFRDEGQFWETRNEKILEDNFK